MIYIIVNYWENEVLLTTYDKNDIDAWNGDIELTAKYFDDVIVYRCTKEV